MDGDIAELIIYPAKLSDHERQTVEVYLARKWGLLSNMPSTIPSPSTHPRTHMSSIGGNSVTTSVPLVDNGGEDANVTIYYGTVDRGPPVDPHGTHSLSMLLYGTMRMTLPV